MATPKIPTPQKAVPPIDAGTAGDDLVAAVNDRLRRIAMLSGNTTTTTVVNPTSGAGGNWAYETPIGTLGTTATFTLSHPPNPATSLELKLNGVVQHQGGTFPGTYTLSGNTITYNTAPISSDWHFAGYSY